MPPAVQQRQRNSVRNGRAKDELEDARGCAVAESRAGQRLHPASRAANQARGKHKQAGKLGGRRVDREERGGFEGQLRQTGTEVKVPMTKDRDGGKGAHD